jgi:signal transduction histidine kinase
MKIFELFSLLASLSLSLFGALQITAEHNVALGIMELSGGAAIAINFISLYLTRNIRLARAILLLIVLGFLVLMLITGGTQDTGVFWFFLFPISTFFLVGRKLGSYWMLTLFGMTVSLAVLAQLDIIQIPYTVVVIRQLLISLFVATMGIYVYQRARENSEAEMQLEQQEVDKAKTEFLTLASHQLRTPISAIAWFSEMLLQGDAGSLSDSQREHIEQIDESNKRSAAIVNAIIQVSNLQTGTLAIRTEQLDLAVLCHEVLEGQLKAQSTRKLEVRERYDARLKKMRFDIDLMKTILQNLISNAIKYTGDGGRIEVAIGPAPKRFGKDCIRIEVSDSGYGIPKNEQSKIFAKLYRASNIKTKDTDGTGLGLFIVKAILEQVGGQIHFDSQEDKGSTFTVLLPSEAMYQRELQIKEKNA